MILVLLLKDFFYVTEMSYFLFNSAERYTQKNYLQGVDLQSLTIGMSESVS